MYSVVSVCLLVCPFVCVSAQIFLNLLPQTFIFGLQEKVKVFRGHDKSELFLSSLAIYDDRVVRPRSECILIYFSDSSVSGFGQ